MCKIGLEQNATDPSKHPELKSAFVPMGEYGTSYLYDRRGNLMKLNRMGNGNTANVLIDKLNYGYEPGVQRPNANFGFPDEPEMLTMPVNNKLMTVSDASGSAEGMATGASCS